MPVPFTVAFAEMLPLDMFDELLAAELFEAELLAAELLAAELLELMLAAELFEELMLAAELFETGTLGAKLLTVPRIMLSVSLAIIGTVIFTALQAARTLIPMSMSYSK
jgi:hypothetical protein